MAAPIQFQAIAPTNLLFNTPKRVSFFRHDKQSCVRRLPLFHELGAKASEHHGVAGLFNNGSFTRSPLNQNYVVRATLTSENETEPTVATKSYGLRGKLNKVVLAYSGGLDTSVIVPWLRENYGCEVVCFTADVGQGVMELDGLEKKAKASGACQLVVKDLKEEFVKDFIFPCLRAGAIYERKYLLGTSMARPVIAKAMVDVAKEVGADAVSHGCTGKGNDQVRFELTFFALNPELNVVAPWREWDIKGREDAIEYAKKHNVPVPVTKKSIYSRDRNLWHLSHEGDILEDPAKEPKKDMFMMSVDPEDAPDQPEYVEIGIVAGLPISLNGKALSPATLLSELNDIGGKHGIGRVDMVENRLVGMKSRGIYETPGGTILFTAARELESLTLDRETIQVKDTLALKYAELVYAGRWFDPLRESMDAFMEKITATTTGSVTLKLYKGSVTVTGRTSPYNLYREDISSFENGLIYDQADAAGFIKLYGLPTRVRAMLEKVSFFRHDKQSCVRRLPLFHELGAKASEHHGVAGLFNNGSFTRSPLNQNYVVRATLTSENETEPTVATKSYGLRGKLNKVVLAYSGGLDTSVIVPWLRENYGCEVVCFTADVGQGVMELDGLEKKAKASGACQLVVKDLKEEFVKDFIFPCLRAGAIYERKYLLGTSMARPVIAKAMVDVAKEVGADAVSHGCTGKGNDQVRFELTFFALNPELNVVAPWREWDIKGREDAIEYAKKHNVPVPVTKKSIYSRDRNLWHLSHEGDILEDPAKEPKKDMFMMSVDPEDAPDQPEYVEIGIVAGLPISLNGKALSPATLLSELNDIGGKHGIGRVDMVENRLVGMKSRGIYETPGGTILFTAARELESLTLDRETIQVKDTLALKYAELVYAGRWFDPLRESMDAFMEKITATTTGSVTLKLYKGSVTVTGRTSPYNLYREDISSFENGLIYDQADAAGFIKLYGLPTRVRAMLEKGI